MIKNLVLIRDVSVIICPLCKDEVWSRHRHDMRHCKCGGCFIDGGRDYSRIGFEYLLEPKIKMADIIYNKKNDMYVIEYKPEPIDDKNELK